MSSGITGITTEPSEDLQDLEPYQKRTAKNHASPLNSPRLERISDRIAEEVDRLNDLREDMAGLTLKDADGDANAAEELKKLRAKRAEVMAYIEELKDARATETERLRQLHHAHIAKAQDKYREGITAAHKDMHRAAKNADQKLEEARKALEKYRHTVTQMVGVCRSEFVGHQLAGTDATLKQLAPALLGLEPFKGFPHSVSGMVRPEGNYQANAEVPDRLRELPEVEPPTEDEVIDAAKAHRKAEHAAA
ncbi:hypothetical protein KBTX_03699 [wastewater metagenome]|uniref:Uncharacterized protein n=2 Tax=unclassified sequences TaxID=12908 RepID=A0A5B8REQ7_9ZZZZ|nr:hypothetical protein [Arhodomonas sp. KWT]QEA07350.1 hypothetical protein KBTEX_03699 [uncultured organism]